MTTLPTPTEPGFYVRYAVDGFGEFQVGPYPTLDRAREELADIRGYEGVRAAHYIQVGDP